MKQELENYFKYISIAVATCGCDLCRRVKPHLQDKRRLASYLLDNGLYDSFAVDCSPNIKEDLISFLASSNKSARHTFGDLLG